MFKTVPSVFWLVVSMLLQSKPNRPFLGGSLNRVHFKIKDDSCLFLALEAGSHRTCFVAFPCKHAIDGHLWPRLLWLASFVMSSSWLQVQLITTLSLWCDLFMMCYYNILWYYFTHPQAIRWVSSWEQIWRNVALLHLLRNGLSAVNGCPNSWWVFQTADKTSQ